MLQLAGGDFDVTRNNVTLPHVIGSDPEVATFVWKSHSRTVEGL